ncbi:methylglyoxal synthase [Delftia tsuruhatensis]|uniref:methylglyoxal synthase n=1 Tax=Delftia tsuruhatensis TaxID=180282 RepID=UPI002444968C|nr:methylglyoxal synthase [Delftia tsuruhatensis]MDH0776234.1 methylglyoxal synthase [Delftia tsuruhatensis]MDH1459826.1 methylglyoxal synthase [Delftia tsuruhatensis]MDH1823174.1 methylglyoxal synthase [Delftia tsuruhatensis]WGG12576.1 methylglyoxal synthase [Delftia tsuruhatensis]
MPIRLGLAANRIHHQTEDAALFGWLRACESGIRELQLGLHAVGRTFDAIQAAGMLASYRGLRRYPYGREGGLMKLVAEVVGVEGDERTIDGAIYLTDPVDPSSIFPEAVALKRQCVIHGKPFLSTVASARDWVEMERIQAGLPKDAGAQRFHDYAQQTLALIAHDALKPTMLDFAARNFELLSRFGRRVGTGTTGQRLNEMAWSRGWPEDRPWVDRYNSGPLGGDAQIADLVLDRRCQRVIFFEDPHVARQHEADIQLLERAVTTVTHDTVCTTSPAVAQRWCDAALMRR